jgi:putative acetyltransferase
MSGVGIRLHQAGSPELVTIAGMLFREYARSLGIDLEYQGFTAELAALPAPYVPPKGALFVAYVGEAVAGCVGLRPLDANMGPIIGAGMGADVGADIGADIGEMKRLYVRPAFRGSGLGKHLVNAVIQAARQAGHRELRLDTLPGMTAAQKLYRNLGFIEIPPYNDKHLPGTRFYTLLLD